MKNTEKVNICGIQIDNVTCKEAVGLILQQAQFGGSSEYVVTPNAHHIVTLQKDEQFRQIYSEAFLVVPDGVSLLWAAQYLRTPLKERVNGTDLLEQLCESSVNEGVKIFLLGGRPGAADSAAHILQSKHPKLNIVGTYCPPYGFENDIEELEKVVSIVKAAAPQIIFVGLGAPKQEKWMHSYLKSIEVPIGIGIGVSFEFISGMVRRAPDWMQKRGLEWFFRFLVEPRRLWKRYIIGNTVFLSLVLKQQLGLLQVE